MRPSIALLVFFFATEALASEQERRMGGRVVAREDRPHRLIHELDVGVGVLPASALYTGLSLGGSYTLHLSEIVALELVDFRYAAALDSGLTGSLETRFGVAPTVEPQVEYLASTGLLFTPLYGKVALFDRAVLNLSTHLHLGFGVANFSDGFRYQVSGGPGVRLHLGSRVSARLDFRGTVAFDELLPLETLLQINLSLGFHFGSRGERAAGTTPAEDPDLVLDALFPGTAPSPDVDEEEPR